MIVASERSVLGRILRPKVPSVQFPSVCAIASGAPNDLAVLCFNPIYLPRYSRTPVRETMWPQVSVPFIFMFHVLYDKIDLLITVANNCNTELTSRGCSTITNVWVQC